jgi:hypothetical protein
MLHLWDQPIVLAVYQQWSIGLILPGKSVECTFCSSFSVDQLSCLGLRWWLVQTVVSIHKIYIFKLYFDVILQSTFLAINKWFSIAKVVTGNTHTVYFESYKYCRILSFWDVIEYSPVDTHQYFGGVYCLLFRKKGLCISGRRVEQSSQGLLICRFLKAVCSIY